MSTAPARRILDVMAGGTTSDAAADALRQGLARHVLERSSEPVLVLNADERVVLANRAATATVGWDGDLVGRHWSELVHPDDAAGLDALAATGEILARLRRDGDFADAHLTIDREAGSASVPWLLVAARYVDAASDGPNHGTTGPPAPEPTALDPVTGWPWLAVDAPGGVHPATAPAGAIAVVVTPDERTSGSNASAQVRRIAELITSRIGPDDLVARGPLGELLVAPSTAGSSTLVDLAERLARAIDIENARSGWRAWLGVESATAGAGADGTFRPAVLAAHANARRGTPPGVAVATAAARRRLRAALDRDELAVDLQPIGDVTTGRIAGFEAVLRSDDPELTDLSQRLDPDDPVAADVGRLLIERSVGMASSLQRAFPEDVVFVATDVSAAGLRRSAWANHLGAMLSEAGLAPGRLCLEVADGSLVLDDHAALERLAPLRRSGIQVAIDGFGERSSSIALVHRLRPDVVKIDPSLVAAIAHDHDARRFLAGAIGLASAVDARVIASGVTSEAQRFELSKLGCPLIQGDLLAPALTWDEAVAMLDRARRSGPTTVPLRAGGRVRPLGDDVTYSHPERPSPPPNTR